MTLGEMAEKIHKWADIFDTQCFHEEVEEGPFHIHCIQCGRTLEKGSPSSKEAWEKAKAPTKKILEMRELADSLGEISKVEDFTYVGKAYAVEQTSGKFTTVVFESSKVPPGTSLFIGKTK